MTHQPGINEPEIERLLEYEAETGTEADGDKNLHTAAAERNGDMTYGSGQEKQELIAHRHGAMGKQVEQILH